MAICISQAIVKLKEASFADESFVAHNHACQVDRQKVVAASQGSSNTVDQEHQGYG
jgi:hypothetical protein